MKPIPWTIPEVLEATGGTLVPPVETGPDRLFAGIVIDSRRVSGDDLFVAIAGEHHDGHRFAADVVKRGCRGLVLAAAQVPSLPLDEWTRNGVACVIVPDTIRALGDLAAFNCRRAGIPVVGITGSNGKTTTRSMIGAVLSRRDTILTTEGNYNNAIGLPLTLFRLSRNHQRAVLELGMNHLGEIRYLTRICRPEIGVITNIGQAHLEGVGPVECVMSAKGELLEELVPGGTAVLNADDPGGLKLARRYSGPTLFFGFSPDAQIRARSVVSEGATTRFTLAMPYGEIPVRLRVPGRFMVSNALAAAAVGSLVGIPPEMIRDGLEAFAPVRGRMTSLSTRCGIHLIDDTYNANPSSVKAALETLRILRGKERGILVIGDMLELGAASGELHREIGNAAAESGVDRICAVGEFARSVASGAAAGGMASDRIMAGTRTEVIDVLKTVLRPGDWLLVKGSRGMAMETVVNAIKEWADGAMPLHGKHDEIDN